MTIFARVRRMFNANYQTCSAYTPVLGIPSKPMGIPPPGDDVQDYHPGTPESVCGYCQRCKRPWKWVKEHVTNYAVSNGCFALCETCWSVLAPSERIPYYQNLVQMWASSTPSENYDATLTDILEAVRQGL